MGDVSDEESNIVLIVTVIARDGTEVPYERLAA